MTEKRTEEDKLAQVPLDVVLGGKIYKVKLLTIKDSRQWRKDVAAMLSPLPKYAQATTDSPELFADAINQMLARMPDQAIDLFFGYAKELDKDEIEAIATDAEMAIAFGQVIDVGFPLAKSLVGTMAKISQ